MSYSVLLNSNSIDSFNLSQTRDLLINLIEAYNTDPAKIIGLNISISEIKKLSSWSDKLVKLMNITGSDEDIILEPVGLI